MGRAALEAEMSRNHRFLNESFNEKATQARMGLESLKSGPGLGRVGEEAREEASTGLGRAGETTKDTRNYTRSDMAVLLNVIGSHKLPTSELRETSQSVPSRTA